MDTEKSLLVQKKINVGQSPNDEGPYYHHIWWESYKGGVKGKLGGIAIGSLIGAATGGVMLGVGALANIAVITTASPLLVLGAFAAAGGLYGSHEFGDVGKAVGSDAALGQQLESRMKTYVEGKTAELKKDLNEIKASVTGKPVINDPKLDECIAAAQEDENGYRKTHYAKLEPTPINSFAFWKVALVGLVIGAAVGALFAYTGLASELLTHGLGDLLSSGASHGAAHGAAAMSGGSIMALSVASFGLMGATFGINRDFFRKVFDKTDLLFKGIFYSQKVKDNQIEAGQKIIDKLEKSKEEPAVTISSAPPEPDYPKSDTFHRDRVMMAAERLQQFDHTRAPMQ